ncbi:MAG TPA: hypothetical protein VFL59_03000 [Candidatus Nanopelagicales bacterium]|nr:hypothetical protein [Candidatus Nanopelagicales bacterium]
MSATTRLVDVSSTGAVADAITGPLQQRDHLALQVVVAVSLGVLAALLATWAVLATMTLHMSI